MPDAELPLSGMESPTTLADREREIALLVDTFYDVVRRDPILGPVFEKRVADWDRHLATMRDFWSAAACRTGRYSGRPINVHRRIPEIEAEHFPRWVSLWQQTVDDVVQSEIRHALKDFARRMATSMSARMGLGPDPVEN